MVTRHFRNVAVLLAILALVVAACGPQATPTPTTAATEEAAPTEEATEVAAATEEATEATVVTEEATEETVATEEATEEAAPTEEATEETVATEEATEEAPATEEATEEVVATEEATEEAVATEEATEEVVATEEATEEAVATEEATEEAAATEEATEPAVEGTQEVEATEEPVPTVDDGAGFVFEIPAGFEVEEGNGLYRLTSGDQLLIVVSPTAYATVLGGQTFEDSAAALAFYLDRTGYTVGETTDGVVAVTLPRRNLAGTASTVDLGEGNTGVILQLTADGSNLPADAAAVVAETMAYTPPPPAEEEAAEEAAAPALTIVGLALNTDGLSTLATAVVRGGFASTLNGEGSFTVFAPTDDAFAAALETLGLTADELLANRELLSSVLSYHVVEGVLTSADLTDGQELTTLNGGTLTVGVADGVVTVTDAQGNTYTVVTADVTASNGVVHVIDGVLMPAGE